MKRTECTLCEKEIPDYTLFVLGHFLIDFFCMFLFVLKIFGWTFVQAFKLGKIKNFPCVCGHKAFWHHVNFTNSWPINKETVSWFYILFKYKFVRDEKNLLANCLRCSIRYTHYTYEPTCFEFQPVNNLTYLEKIYEKKKR